MKKNFYKFLLLLCLVSSGTMAQNVFYFDFGNFPSTQTTPGNWNNMEMNGAQQFPFGLPTIINTAGTSFTYPITVLENAPASGIGSFDGANNTGVTGVTVGDFPPTATQDFLFVNNGNTGHLTIGGLDNAKYYSFVVYASRAAAGPRVTNYTFVGANTGMGSLETANNSTNFVTILNIKPNAGVIDLGVAGVTSFGYLGVMKMTESVTPAATNEYLFDFGNFPTTAPTYVNWNNMEMNGAQQFPFGLTGLVSTSGSISPYNIAVLETAPASGIGSFDGANNTGVTGITLGDFPPTATQDFLFVNNGNTGHMTISGLDNAKFYSFIVYASRAAGGPRVTTYTFTGSNTVVGTLETAGNSTQNVAILNVQPSAGVIDLGVAGVTSFGYLGAMKMTESVAALPNNNYLFDFGNFPTTAPTIGNWNNMEMNGAGQYPFTLPTVISSAGATSPYALNVLETAPASGIGSFDGANNTGVTGVTVGNFPPSATQDFFFVNNGNTGKLAITGLDNTKYYSFIVYASRAAAGPRVTNYTFVGTNTVVGSLDAALNSTNTATIANVQPSAGIIILNVAGVTSFGYLGAMEMSITGSVLPITTQYFTGSKQASSNILDWKVTCTSAPSITMILERSADGKNFKTIQTLVETAARCAQNFTYTDALPLIGINYYRLKTIDENGKVNYSIIVPLLNKANGFELINVQPNPVKDIAQLILTSARSGKITIAVTDLNAKILTTQVVTVIAGNNPLNMNFASLAAGIYTITATNTDGEVNAIRFVKY